VEPTKSFVAKTVPALRRKPTVMIGAAVAVAAGVITFAGLWLWSSWKKPESADILPASSVVSDQQSGQDARAPSVALASKPTADVVTVPSSSTPSLGTVVQQPAQGQLAVTPMLNPSSSLQHGLVLHFSFDNVQGDKVIDESGTGNHGTLKGATVTSGVVRAALAFNDKDAIVTVPHSSSLNLDKHLTAAAWIKGDQSQPGNWPFIINKFIHTEKLGFNLAVHSQNGTGGFHVFPKQNASQHSECATSDDVTLDDRWHHLVGSSDGTQLRYYVDGILQGTTPFDGQIAPTDKELTIGSGFDGNTWFPFKGSIDEVAIFNRTLSDNEVKQLHELGKRGQSLKTATAPQVPSRSISTVADSSAPTPAVVAPQPAAQSGQQWTNSLGMKFVPVPGTAVLFSIWDTRVQDYQVFVAATGRSYQQPKFQQGPTHPAVNMSWEDTKAFCDWLTLKERQEGSLSPQQIYRLPTDAEWSVAVGLPPENGDTPKDNEGKNKEAYPWGGPWPPPKGAGNYHNRLGTDDFEFTSPVDYCRPNRFGLYDMGGNVWQWCEDWYDNAHTVHAYRGACWFNSGTPILLSSCRNEGKEPSRDGVIGFRCVLAGGAVSARQAQSGAASTTASSPAPTPAVIAPQSTAQAGEAWTIEGSRKPPESKTAAAMAQTPKSQKSGLANAASPSTSASTGIASWVDWKLPAPDPAGWVTLFDGKKLYGCSPTSKVLASGQVYFKDGYLCVNDAWFSFDWKGQNAAIRARVKKINGKHVALHIGPCFAWYGNGFGISQKVPDRDRAPILISRKLMSKTTGFVDLELSMTGRQLEFKFNGAVVLTTQARPFENNEKSVQVSTWQGLSQFERIEVKQ
ncbi:MAG: SUMF1/EgtB/PvdO family nonheme iron enzyme, partial [Verrucomicrobia bacterium]|nr:SUMF1/EgtB/PvdO family nonheme iron enzyme [Verrucomicrobiota bacterium]